MNKNIPSCLPIIAVAIILLFCNLCLASDQSAEKLGWIATSKPADSCGGHYADPLLKLQATPDIDDEDIHLRADRALLHQYGYSTLSGNVQLRRTKQHVTTDKANIYRDAQTHKINKIDLFGNIRLIEPGKLLIANQGMLYPQKQTGILNDSLYRINFSDEISRQLGITSLYGLNAWGTADSIEIEAPGVYRLQNASYSTCAPTTTPAWRLVAQQIHFDKNTGKGYAKQARLQIKSVPVLYLPYISFSINEQRKTGFLLPTVGYSSKSGFELSQPFYLNLAPNYDAMITPTWLSYRGILLDSQFRYLTQTSSGLFDIGFLPNDREFSRFKDKQAEINPPGSVLDRVTRQSNNRFAFHFENNTYIDPHWTGTANFNYVSDDYYLQDLTNNLEEITENQLLRQASLSYSNRHWQLIANVQAYQSLHPINQVPVQDIYRRLPQLIVNADYPDAIAGFNMHLNAEYNYFDHPSDPFTNQNFVNGNRFDIRPLLSYPFETDRGYITPAIELNITHYALNDQANTTRILPSVSIDTGTYLDRNIQLGNNTFIQTLEPRIVYRYTPYDNQDDIPLFDTDYPLFSYQQLFRSNRFIGRDRIGDTHQFSVGLSSRIIDNQTGKERLRMSLGQIYYLKDRRVTLCNTPSCSDEDFINFTADDTATSPLVAEIIYTINPHWFTTSSVAYNPSNTTLNNGYLGLHYADSKNRVLNFNYSYLRDGDRLPTDSGADLNQFSISYVWPLTSSWSTLGSWSYNIAHHHEQTYFFGLEYNNCCWAIRAIGGKVFTSLNQDNRPQFNDVFYLQFLLKGLGSFSSSSPKSILRSTIPGYNDIFSG